MQIPNSIFLKKTRLIIIATLAIVFSGVAISAKAEITPKSEKDPIVVGSKAFTESKLLTEIMAQLIEARSDIPVIRKTNLTGSKMVFSAIQNGEIDVYPDYIGTVWMMLKIKKRTSNSLEAFLMVKKELEKNYGISCLSPFGFNNSYALAMYEDAAEKLKLRKISDLKGLEKTLRMGFSHEFLNRSDGYLGLIKLYGLEFNNPQGIDHGLAYEAISGGVVDIVDTWTTDGKLSRYKIRLLEDDLRFFPPYDALPIIRMDTLKKYPEIREILELLAFKISDKKMQELNYKTEELGGAFEQVARQFLEEEGLLDENAAAVVLKNKKGLMDFIASRAEATMDLTVRHIGLTSIAVLLAALLAAPLGVLLTRREKLAQPILGVAGVIQTIPSLALLAFMIPIPFLGLGTRSAIAALFLYALLPILRNTYTGIKEIDPELIEAARGIGLKDHQILFKVELPLAARTIMAGIRTSTVISVGVATLAAFVGAGGLGDPIITGLQLNDTRMVLSGAIPAAALAIVMDALLGKLETILAPYSG